MKLNIGSGRRFTGQMMIKVYVFGLLGNSTINQLGHSILIVKNGGCSIMLCGSFER